MKARARIRAEELNALLELVGGEYNVTPKELLGRSRTQPLSEARQCAMAFLRGRGHTFHAIGEKFGRDHGTVVHACAAIKGKAEVRTDLKERIQRIKDAIGDCERIPTSQVRLVVTGNVPGHKDMTTAQLLYALATQSGLRNSDVKANRI